MRINTARYVALFHDIVKKEMPKASINFREEDMTSFDHINEQRQFNFKMSQ